ncbi:hypothetical protein D8Y20_06120 [Mariprofundus sp. EBB-1]|uniref:hypothetical protein n=1 Tax=Mariprofundus sp. EBB-1 TaxID=2650971 RepID=UPI000EF17DD4|nr:hypothetical protein [Mariprofundus sp. EBB-1]RLL52829.1 hypothetical protein D8Y20_06120 [Mariprofundus sp. EBB-1]
MKILSLFIALIVILSGCSAHRIASIGKINNLDGWEAHPTQLNEPSTTLWKASNENKGENALVIEVSSCNYGQKTFFMVIPPVPLGTMPSLENEPVFIVTVSMLSLEGNYSISPASIQYEDSKGIKYSPISLSVGQNICDIETELSTGKMYHEGEYISVLQPPRVKRTWIPTQESKTYEAKARTENSAVEVVSLSVMFKVKPPSVEEIFYLSIPVSHDGKSIEVPKLTFTKETVWGGW